MTKPNSMLKPIRKSFTALYGMARMGQFWIMPCLTLVLIARGVAQEQKDSDISKPIESTADAAKFETSLAEFQSSWKAEDWEKEFRNLDGYIRVDNGDHWKKRFLALRDAVVAGQRAIPTLMQLLNTGSEEEQVFAAQALSFISPETEFRELAAKLEDSPIDAVRLYCVDALSTLGETSRKIDWPSLAQRQTNRDVKKHINYAIERKGNRIGGEAISALTAFKDEQAGSAILNQPAPDFELKTISGKAMRLSDYRGKKNVVLVFIYGDT